MTRGRVLAVLLMLGVIVALYVADRRDHDACERAGGLYLARKVTTVDGTRTDCIATPTAVEYER